MPLRLCCTLSACACIDVAARSVACALLRRCRRAAPLRRSTAQAAPAAPDRHPDLDRRMALGLSRALRAADASAALARARRARRGADPGLPVEDVSQPLHDRHRALPDAPRHRVEQHRRTRRCRGGSRSATATCSRTRAGGAASRSGSPPSGRARSPATMFWPGSDVEIAGDRPTYWRMFDHELANDERVDQLLDWLQRARAEAPDVPHAVLQRRRQRRARLRARSRRKRGRPLEHIDAAIARLVTGVEAAGLTARTNFVLVSDHGMAALSPRSRHRARRLPRPRPPWT